MGSTEWNAFIHNTLNLGRLLRPILLQPHNALTQFTH